VADRVAGAPPECLPAVVVDILQNFHPDLEIAKFLHKICANRCSPEQLTPLAQYLAIAAEVEAADMNNAEEAARLWLTAEYYHRHLNNDAKALQCARNAVQSSPGAYEAHYQLGLCLLRHSQFAEAESHLRWCLQRTPGDQDLENRIRDALKGRDQQRRAANESKRAATR
jgi:hypothetical protein